ncbi:MAG: hypothetical protein ACREF4_03400 [Gammaproteobacteria bacterium]
MALAEAEFYRVADSRLVPFDERVKQKLRAGPSARLTISPRDQHGRRLAWI